MDAWAGFPLEERIEARAGQCGLTLPAGAAERLAAHAREVMAANDELHLTAITEPEEFLERHLGESFEGAAMLDAGVRGILVDLGSGNGYPGIPVVEARPGLQLVLTEASAKKAAFLRECVFRAALERVELLEAHVQRPDDLDGNLPVAVLTSRAMRGWPKVLPRFARALDDQGQVLLWAGADVEAVSGREVWRRLRFVEKRALPGREASWIWRFVRA